jgi:ribosomal protein S18 acetylase RimI-like enzyme
VNEWQLGSGVVLRSATLNDLPALLSICLRTADSGKDATHLHNLPDLVGEIYAAPYLLHEPNFAYVLVDGVSPVGYVLGALDTSKFESTLVKEYWPKTKEKYKSISTAPLKHDVELLAELEKQGYSDSEIIAQYPSHLHIDIIESHQGFGYGKAMIEHLLNELRIAGSRGVHLHMSAANDRAFRFYQKFGFSEIYSDENEKILALDLFDFT